MDKRAIFTVWNGRVAPVFDVAGKAVYVEINGEGGVSKKNLDLPEKGIAQKISFIKSLDIEIIVCGAISRAAFYQILEEGIDIFAFISGSIEEVIDALFKGDLQRDKFVMPGCNRGNCRNRNRSIRKGGGVRKLKGGD